MLLGFGVPTGTKAVVVVAAVVVVIGAGVVGTEFMRVVKHPVLSSDVKNCWF